MASPSPPYFGRYTRCSSSLEYNENRDNAGDLTRTWLTCPTHANYWRPAPGRSRVNGPTSGDGLSASPGAGSHESSPQ
jgi:hypothetical protein